MKHEIQTVSGDTLTAAELMVHSGLEWHLAIIMLLMFLSVSSDAQPSTTYKKLTLLGSILRLQKSPVPCGYGPRLVMTQPNIDSKSGLCATVMSRKKVHLFSQFCFILITVGLRTVRLQQVSGQADKVQLNQVIRYKIWTE